jgi:hypothetical protein
MFIGRSVTSLSEKLCASLRAKVAQRSRAATGLGHACHPVRAIRFLLR